MDLLTRISYRFRICLYNIEMAYSQSAISLDTDNIVIRQIQARSLTNQWVPEGNILISGGPAMNGLCYWASVSTIATPPFVSISDSYGSTLVGASTQNNILFRTVGVGGLFDAYIDANTSSFTFNNSAPNLLVAQTSVPIVSRAAAEQVPNSENIIMSTSQSTLKFIGVGDIQLSTVTDLRSVFFSISSFTAKGYSDLSSVARAWPGYAYSTLSTNAGYASFISSVPFSTFINIDEYTGYGWNWSNIIGTDIPLSTIEPYPAYYSTGDVYFSTVSFTMAPYLRYIRPNSTTKMFLEVTPNYFFQRMYLGTSTPYNLIKEFSSFVQYQSPQGNVRIMGTSVNTGYITSQNSNAYSSNFYDKPIKMELDANMIASNARRDGPYGAYYTLYHRIPGGMANLIKDPYCGYSLGERGGFSNSELTMDNYTARSNAVFLHVYNQDGNQAPMPGP